MFTFAHFFDNRFTLVTTEACPAVINREKPVMFGFYRKVVNMQKTRENWKYNMLRKVKVHFAGGLLRCPVRRRWPPVASTASGDVRRLALICLPSGNLVKLHLQVQCNATVTMYFLCSDWWQWWPRPPSRPPPRRGRRSWHAWVTCCIFTSFLNIGSL